MELVATAYVPPQAPTSLATSRQGIVSPLAQKRAAPTSAPVGLESAVSAPVSVSAGLGRPTVAATGPDRLDRPRDRTRQGEVSFAALAFLFSEMISHFQSRVSGVAQLERRLSLVGYSIGQRILLLTTHRLEMASNPKLPRRETRLVPALLFVHTHIYRQAFGKPADSLERSTEREDECTYTLQFILPTLAPCLSFVNPASLCFVTSIFSSLMVTHFGYKPL